MAFYRSLADACEQGLDDAGMPTESPNFGSRRRLALIVAGAVERDIKYRMAEIGFNFLYPRPEEED